MRHLICMLGMIAVAGSARAAVGTDVLGPTGDDNGVECSCQLRDMAGQIWQPEIQKAFNAADKNRDGKISADEWVSLRRKVEQAGDVATGQKELTFAQKLQNMLDGTLAIDDCITAFDTDKDGKLDDQERVAFFTSLVDQQQLLKRFDKNHDGVLDEDERDTSVTASDSKPLEQMIEQADVNRDGALNPAEGMAMLAMIAQGQKENFSGVIDYFDADGDGMLSDKEKESANLALGIAYQQHEKRMLDQFDANHDGKLDATERQAAMDAQQQPQVRCVCISKSSKAAPEAPKQPVKDPASKTSMK